VAAVDGLAARGPRDSGERPDLGDAAVEQQLDGDAVHLAGGPNPEQQRLAGHRLDGPALFGVGDVGVAGATRAVADHASVSFLSSAASRSSMAWLHSSGVATGPHLSSHSCR